MITELAEQVFISRILNNFKQDCKAVFFLVVLKPFDTLNHDLLLMSLVRAGL